MNKYILFILINTLVLTTSYAIEPLSNEQLREVLANGIVISSKSTKVEVLNELGTPKEKKISTIRNPHNDKEDTVTSFEYPGITIKFYDHFEHKYPTRLVTISVSDNKYKLPHGLHIGMTKEQLDDLFLKIIDKRTRDRDGRLMHFYQAYDSVHDQLIVTVENGVISAVRWSNWP